MKKQKIYMMADIHGDFKPVRDFYKRNPYILKDNSNVLILLGDAGLNFFFNHRDEEFKKALGKYPFTYFVIRGNHEERPSICTEKNPDKWHKESFFNNFVWVENDYPYIKYAMDYPCTYIINGYKTLILPGAYSVDKYVRLQRGWSWFESEMMTAAEMEIARQEIKSSNDKFDLVLSHTCPILYEPTDLFLSCVDQSMVDKTMERFLGEVEYNLDYKAWCWGHYHSFRDYPRTDDRFRTMFFNDYALDLDEYMNGEVNKL